MTTSIRRYIQTSQEGKRIRGQNESNEFRKLHFVGGWGWGARKLSFLPLIPSQGPAKRCWKVMMCTRTEARPNEPMGETQEGQPASAPPPAPCFSCGAAGCSGPAPSSKSSQFERASAGLATWHPTSLTGSPLRFLRPALSPPALWSFSLPGARRRGGRGGGSGRG